MRILQITISLSLIGLLIWLNRSLVPPDLVVYGGLTWVGWASLLIVAGGIGLLFIAHDVGRALGFFRVQDKQAVAPIQARTLLREELDELGLDKYGGPRYPHPVVFPDRCIGCKACVDACPHGVLDIVDGVAAATAPDLCMEDTACQAECPVNPKACIVINTTKPVRERRMPARDGSTYETNVPGCYLIGDVSGVPLIKNAVNEGANVIAHIAAGLRNAPLEPRAEYDVAIIGMGPGGASAAVSAVEANLRYIAIEQGKALSTIDLYPKGKYVHFKPDTKDWSGGIPAVGLGLINVNYGSSISIEDRSVWEVLGPELDDHIREEVTHIQDELLARIPVALRAELSPLIADRIEVELKARIAQLLRSKGIADWRDLSEEQAVSDRNHTFAQIRSEISDLLQTKIAGDQREKLLHMWSASLTEKGVRVNEYESCRSINRAADGDYFIIETEHGPERSPVAHTARRVVIAIGLRGSPNRLGLPNEEMVVRIDGRDRPKVMYDLSDPDEFWGSRIAVVGGGNVAVEAAVNLVSRRQGSTISVRAPERMNKVTLLVRDHLAPTVRFANKLLLYKYVDEGVIELLFGVTIKEIRENELVLEDASKKTELETIPNDLVFALIGGRRPNTFLQSIGIEIN